MTTTQTTEAADLLDLAAEPNDDVVQKPLHHPTEPDGGGEPEFRLSTPIRILRWTELLALESDYRSVRTSEQTDRWFFLDGGEVSGPVSFTEVLERLRDGQSPMDVLHESKAEDEKPMWTEMVYTPVWNRPVVALWWTVGFWLMALGAGFVALQFALPMAARGVGAILYWLATAAIVFRKVRSRFARPSAAVEGE